MTPIMPKAVQLHPYREKLTLSQKELRDRLGKCAAERMQAIAESYINNVKGYKENSKLLDLGFWDNQTYLQACQEHKLTKRIEFLKKDRFRNLLCGWVPSKYFSRIESSEGISGYLPYGFTVKKNKSPSEALEALFKGPAIIDCTRACYLAYYGALYDILKADKFNRLFSSCTRGFMNTRDSVDVKEQPLQYFIQTPGERFLKIAGKLSNRPVKIGQLVSFAGVTDYLKKKPYSAASRWNVICTKETKGEQTFSGLGLNNPVSEAQINEQLLKEYNVDEDPLSMVPEDFKKTSKCLHPEMDLLRNHKATEVQGFLADFGWDFNAPLIEALLELPLEKISMKFVDDFNMDQVKKCLSKFLRDKENKHSPTKEEGKNIKSSVKINPAASSIQEKNLPVSRGLFERLTTLG